MDVATLSTVDSRLVEGVRATLSEARIALLCVAFVHERGLGLIEKEVVELKKRGGAARLLVTTTFDREEGAALSVASELGFEVKVLNPGGRTYHPKLYLGADGSSTSAVIGSANLTGGLATNLEIGVRIQGRTADPALRDAWSWAETQWNDARATIWQPARAAERLGAESFDPDLYAPLHAQVARSPEFWTLGGQRKLNRVLRLSDSEAWVETDKSRAEGVGGKPIPAWMFNLAWRALKNLGSLSNHQLLNGLRVHRSSAVCAILARIPGVEVEPGPGINLRWHQGAR